MHTKSPEALAAFREEVDAWTARPSQGDTLCTRDAAILNNKEMVGDSDVVIQEWVKPDKVNDFLALHAISAVLRLFGVPE